ncbi:MAG: PaaI family thioesterase [Bacteroidales bacterium]|nr:PaaI family thioesterase [Bacteroidales bacterium]MCD8393740.1 PaaI family thioesterase [Bacteroidales bacterium]
MKTNAAMKKVKNPWLGLPGYNCMGCAPHNPIGLHMHFEADPDTETLWGYWEPSADYQSWPGVVHGGVQAMMLDEGAEWWLNVFRKTAGYTAKMEVRYHRTVRYDEGPLWVRATHIKDLRAYVELDVAIINSRDVVCTSAKVTYLQMPADQAQRDYNFTGCELTD